MKTETPRPVRLKDYRPPDFLIDTVHLKVSLHPTETRIRNRMKLRRNPDAHGATPNLRLDGENLVLKGIKLNRKPLSKDAYQVTKDTLTIRSIPAGDAPFTLEIESVVNPEANTRLEGLYRTRGVYCTQCEAQGFRHITYFLDRPDVLSRYTVEIDADQHEAPVLLSNGNLIERGTLGQDGRHYAVWRDPHPKPCYLFALVGGDLSSIASTYRTSDGQDVDLRIYVEHGKEARASWAMESLKRSMKWDEDTFGRSYDLDIFNIVAVSDFNLGAMENKSLNIFNDRLILASEDTATDTTFAAIESVVAHEYFHNWTGNRITCRDWFQLCLKEGLTVFRDQEFSADERSRVVQRINDVRRLKSAQFTEDAGPLAHPVRPSSYIEINNFYTATVYEKGAELIRMLKTLLGADGFRAGMDVYFARHDGDATTVEAFIACFEDATKRNLTQFFRWYEQAGTPTLKCALSYDKKKNIATLEFEQILPETPDGRKPKPLHLPVRIGLLDRDGNDLALKPVRGEVLRDGLVELTKRKTTVRFQDVPSRPIASILRDFSAPVHLQMKVSTKDLAFLMGHDRDLFNRWQSGNLLATRILKKLTKTGDVTKLKPQITAFSEALKTALSDDRLEAAYRAELMQLPTQNDLARELGRNVDPDAIAKAHRAFCKLVAQRLSNQLEALYDHAPQPKTFSPDAQSAGNRALRNAALALLLARGKKQDLKRAKAHFDSANNMTDEAQALFLLTKYDKTAGEAALKQFFEKWKDDHVVIDTWFAAQARVPRASALAKMKALTEHDLFARTLPNKVRALLGNFAMENPTQFHRADGRGYAFVADELVKLDKINPQIAARLLNCFRAWRTLEPKRRRHAKDALQRVASTSGISRDVYEIAHKTLKSTQ